MAYTIRNVRPSVLHIVDADLRLESGQTAVVPALTPQMQSLLTLRALEVVTHDGPSAPIITPPAPDGPLPPASEVAVPTPAEPPPTETPADTSTAMPAVEEKRGGRKAATHAVTTGGRDDAR